VSVYAGGKDEGNGGGEGKRKHDTEKVYVTKAVLNLFLSFFLSFVLSFFLCSLLSLSSLSHCRGVLLSFPPPHFTLPPFSTAALAPLSLYLMPPFPPSALALSLPRSLSSFSLQCSTVIIIPLTESGLIVRYC